jgi:hypothetical protein
MPSIGKIEIRKDRPNFPVAGENPSYTSPDGRLTLEFYDADEFHMGAYAWKLRLFARGGEALHEHRFLSSGRWRHPEHYQPWQANSLQFVLANWKPEVTLYNLESKKSTRCNIAGHIFAAAASKNLPRIAIQGDASVFLLDADGIMVASLPEHGRGPERPALVWFDKAGCLLQIGREVEAHSPMIECFEATTGKVCGRLPLDPNVLLPYPASKYASIQRNTYSLILSHSRRTVGHYLDIWTRVVFDDSRSVLQLETYRPSSEPFTETGKTFCSVEPRWIEVELLP